VVVSGFKQKIGLGSLQWYQSFDPPNLWRNWSMKRYSGIFMGRRKKPTSETKAKMEGLGDDREPQGLAFLAAKFNKFHQTLNLIEVNLVHRLQENQETNLRGHDEITKNLKKVDGNLRKIDEN
jgi:hypothetical protein